MLFIDMIKNKIQRNQLNTNDLDSTKALIYIKFI